MGATLALSAGLSSCAVHRVVVPADPRLTEKTGRADRVVVAGYTTTDGRYHRFNGYLALTGDSLVLTHPATSGMGFLASSPESVVVLPREGVLSVKLYRGVSIFRSVSLVLSLLVVLAVVDCATVGCFEVKFR
jgi:hypothetical protein